MAEQSMSRGGNGGGGDGTGDGGGDGGGTDGGGGLGGGGVGGGLGGEPGGALGGGLGGGGGSGQYGTSGDAPPKRNLTPRVAPSARSSPESGPAVSLRKIASLSAKVKVTRRAI